MLKATQERIGRKAPVRIVFYGDSISEVKPGWSGGASSPEAHWGARLALKELNAGERTLP